MWTGLDDDGRPTSDLPWVGDLTEWQANFLARIAREWYLNGSRVLPEPESMEFHDLMVKLAEAESFYKFKDGQRVTDNESEGTVLGRSMVTATVNGHEGAKAVTSVLWDAHPDYPEDAPDKDDYFTDCLYPVEEETPSDE